MWNVAEYRQKNNQVCVGYWDKQCGGYIDGNRYRHNRVINRCESAEMGKCINAEMINNEMLKDGSWKLYRHMWKYYE